MRSSKLFAGLAAAALFSAVAPLTHAATVPSVTHLAVTATGSNAVGGSVTVTATGGTSNGESFDTSWWVYEPNGTWVQAQNWSTSHTFQLAHLGAGSYEIQAESLTPQQLAAGDWPSTVGAHTVVNVETSVAITSATVPTSNGTVTVTAQATNIHDPVYQWWVDANGQWIQDPYGYGAANTFTFQETSPNERVVVYAKTVPAPNDAGSALGITASQSNTPGDVLLAEENASYQTRELFKIEQADPSVATQLAASGGAMTYQMLNAPSPQTIAPFIPSGVPVSGSVTGATALYALESSSLVAADPSISSAVWIAGIQAAEAYANAFSGNDPLSLYNDASSVFAEIPVSKPYLNYLNVDETESYPPSTGISYEYLTAADAVATNAASVALGEPFSTDSFAKLAPPPGLPSALLELNVPVTETAVYGDAQGAWYGTVPFVIGVALQPDAVTPSGYTWTFLFANQGSIASQQIWSP